MILSYFNKKENRRLNQLLIPTVYIILIAALIPIVKENIFLIVVFEIFIRNFYITNIINNEKEVNNTTFIIESLLSIIISVLTYNLFISKVDTVIPDPESIRPFIWFLIILFIIYLYRISTKDLIIKRESKKTTYKREKNILQYAKFKNKYSYIVKSKNNKINNTLYAIMVYNDYNTPQIKRSINAYIGLITKRETKYGIMQVSSFERLSDEDSILFVLNDFERKVKSNKSKTKDIFDILTTSYSEKEKQDIKKIYDDIVGFSK
jgi:hypothetical protein